MGSERTPTATWCHYTAQYCIMLLASSSRVCLLECQEPPDVVYTTESLRTNIQRHCIRRRPESGKIGGPLKWAAVFGRTPRTCLTPALIAGTVVYSLPSEQSRTGV